MHKCLSIFFLGIYLLGATAFNQMLRIPMLIQHYAQFEKDNPGFGFGTFLRVHYLYPQRTDDNDYAEDMSLPFKSVDVNYLLAAGGCIIPQPYYFSAPKKFLPARNFPVFNEPMDFFTYSRTIFQPPKA